MNVSSIHQLIDITETVEIRLDTPLSETVVNRIRRESFESLNLRAMLRQSTLASALSTDEADTVTITAPKWPLPHVLRETAPLQTVIVSSTNCGFLDFAQNWLLAMKMLPDADEYSNSFMLIAEDMRAFHDLERVIPGRIVLPPFEIKDESEAYDYYDHRFGKLVSSRPQFLIKLLEQGYTFLWSDVDIVYNRNPMPHLIHSPHDYVGQTDFDRKIFHTPINNMCTCFMYMRPGNKKLNELLYAWYEATKEGNSEDQLPFNRILGPVHKSINMTILEPYHQFPPGWMYFENPHWYKANQQPEPVFIHNNWIVGPDKKRERFKNVGKWLIADHSHARKKC
jgi:rhamnogalacturonan II specific xylosyltransferase